MSGDPFANTTTVKNILQHVISPKLVRDGNGGYVSKTDLVNVHNIVFAPGSSTEDGTISNPFTTQCGTILGSTTEGATTVYHSRVTTNSVIFASMMSSAFNPATGYPIMIVNVIPNDTGAFTITCDTPLPDNTRLGWFIARF